jgi:hypothetical protein
LICKGFRVSPADYRGRFCPENGRPADYRKMCRSSAVSRPLSVAANAGGGKIARW